jgi:hypothetical protein
MQAIVSESQLRPIATAESPCKPHSVCSIRVPQKSSSNPTHTTKMAAFTPNRLPEADAASPLRISEAAHSPSDSTLDPSFSVQAVDDNFIFPNSFEPFEGFSFPDSSYANSVGPQPSNHSEGATIAGSGDSSQFLPSNLDDDFFRDLLFTTPSVLGNSNDTTKITAAGSVNLPAHVSDETEHSAHDHVSFVLFRLYSNADNLCSLFRDLMETQPLSNQVPIQHRYSLPNNNKSEKGSCLRNQLKGGHYHVRSTNSERY